MLNFIIKLSVLILIILQIGLMIYMFYLNYKREQEDKKFWERLHNDMDTSTKEYINTLEELKLINKGESEQKK